MRSSARRRWSSGRSTGCGGCPPIPTSSPNSRTSAPCDALATLWQRATRPRPDARQARDISFGEHLEEDIVQQMQAPTPVFTRTSADRRAHLMRELVETLLFVGLIFLIVQFAIKPYRIVGLTMQPQLQPDQLVVVNRTAFLFGGPDRKSPR